MCVVSCVLVLVFGRETCAVTGKFKFHVGHSHSHSHSSSDTPRTFQVSMHTYDLLLALDQLAEMIRICVTLRHTDGAARYSDSRLGL